MFIGNCDSQFYIRKPSVLKNISFWNTENLGFSIVFGYSKMRSIFKYIPISSLCFTDGGSSIVVSIQGCGPCDGCSIPPCRPEYQRKAVQKLAFGNRPEYQRRVAQDVSPECRPELQRKAVQKLAFGNRPLCQQREAQNVSPDCRPKYLQRGETS